MEESSKCFRLATLLTDCHSLSIAGSIILEQTKTNSFVEFESNWFTGIHFFVAFKRPDGSINVLLNQNDDFPFNTATISGKVFSEPNGVPPFEPLLKVNNLCKDNLGRHHLNISGKKENNPLQTLPRRLQSG